MSKFSREHKFILFSELFLQLIFQGVVNTIIFIIIFGKYAVFVIQKPPLSQDEADAMGAKNPWNIMNGDFNHFPYDILSFRGIIHSLHPVIKPVKFGILIIGAIITGG